MSVWRRRCLRRFVELIVDLDLNVLALQIFNRRVQEVDLPLQLDVVAPTVRPLFFIDGCAVAALRCLPVVPANLPRRRAAELGVTDLFHGSSRWLR